MFATPEEAEAAFYLAFQQADLGAMMRVWMDDDSVVCIHPNGPRLTGRPAVEKSWAEIFERGSPMRFEITEARYLHSEHLAIHSVHENISFGQRYRQQSLVLATNIYRKTADGWRMIIHHASPGQAVDVDTPEVELQTLH